MVGEREREREWRRECVLAQLSVPSHIDIQLDQGPTLWPHLNLLLPYSKYNHTGDLDFII